MAAAQYFAQQPYRRRIKVIESKTSPQVRLQGSRAGCTCGPVERGRRGVAIEKSTDVVRQVCGDAIVTVVETADFWCDDNASGRQP
jgi:hypothetical protein